MNSRRLIQLCATLEQKLDPVLFRNPDDEESTVGRIAKGAAVGGAGVAGAKYADSAIMKKYGSRNLLNQGASGPLGSHNMAPGAAGGTAAVGRAGAYRSAASDLGQTVANRAQSGLRAGRHAAGVLAEDGQGSVRSVLGGLRKGIRVASRFSSVLERVTELSDRCDEAIEFGLAASDHLARHIGGPFGVAATSRKGKKVDALKESAADLGKNTAGGFVGGAGLGAAVGSGVLARNVAKGGVGSMAKRELLKDAAHSGRFKAAALVGAGLGAYAGTVAGTIRGTHGKRQREIQDRYHA